MTDPIKITTSVILAGGRGNRMEGKDKGLLQWRGKPIIAHILECVVPQTTHVLINANRNLETYRRFAYPVISDILPGFQGPLVGILSAMHECKNDYLLCIPCDTPHPPDDLCLRLHSAIQNHSAQAAIVHDGTRLQPLFAMMSRDLYQPLNNYLTHSNKVRDFFQQQKTVIVDFSDQYNKFQNINTPEDLERLSRQDQ